MLNFSVSNDQRLNMDGREVAGSWALQESDRLYVDIGKSAAVDSILIFPFDALAKMFSIFLFEIQFRERIYYISIDFERRCIDICRNKPLNDAINTVYSSILLSYFQFSLKRDLPEFMDFRYSFGRLHIVCNVVDCTQCVIDILQAPLARISIIFDDMEKQSSTESNERRLDFEFSFPDETREACNQYLLYFAQFLRDIGINTDTEIKSSATKTLFSVFPLDMTDSLRAIQDALAVYLRLPVVPPSQLPIASNDLAAAQLQSQVFFFQSQISLAVATIRANEATIDAQRAALAAQEATIRSLQNYMLPSQSDKQGSDGLAQKNEPETILGGTVRITKFNKFGVEIDLAEILRRLRRRT